MNSIIVNSSNLFSLIRERKVSIYIYSWINRIQDPSYFLSTFSSPKNIINFPIWSNEQVDILNDLIQKTTDLDIRKKLHYQAEKILYQEKPVIPLITSPIYSQTLSNVHNIYIGDSQEFDIRYCYKK